MTKILISLMITIFSTVSFQASADKLVFNKVIDDVTYVSQLSKFKIDPASNLPQNIKAAYIQIRLLGDKPVSAALTSYRAFSCPAGRFCTMMMPIPLTVQVRVNDFSINACGVKIYQGTTTGGNQTENSLIKLTVVDNTNNSCPTIASLDPTEVIYETVNTETHQTSHSVLAGSKLEVQNEVHNTETLVQ